MLFSLLLLLDERLGIDKDGGGVNRGDRRARKGFTGPKRFGDATTTTPRAVRVMPFPGGPGTTKELRERRNPLTPENPLLKTAVLENGRLNKRRINQPSPPALARACVSGCNYTERIESSITSSDGRRDFF